MKQNPLTAVIVGAGHRSLNYAEYARINPDRLQITGVADPNPLRRREVAELYHFGKDRCWNSAEELAAAGKVADAVINGTMDTQHVPTTLPLLAAGYDVLLEKPFAVSLAEVSTLREAVRKYKRKVMICHVLRYAPFYVEIKKMLAANKIGEIVNIQTVEHVSYHHIASCFVRGKWHRHEICGSSMLMSKCCHDLDLIMWMLSGIKPLKVGSFGGLHYFSRDKAPAGAGEYCLLDCPIEKDCLYSARKHYLDHPDRWSFYVWAGIEHIRKPTLKDKEDYLRSKDNTFGKCVWKCDNNVVDRQSVMIEFTNGATATHNMVGGTSRPMRQIHIIGTTGEIQGIMDESKFTIRHIDPRPGCEYSEDVMDLKILGDMTGAFGGHGGGDQRLVSDFVEALSGGNPSISCTDIEDSINGHLTGFAADLAMNENRIVNLADEK
jgi:predicted dehydrogenase